MYEAKQCKSGTKGKVSRIIRDNHKKNTFSALRICERGQELLQLKTEIKNTSAHINYSETEKFEDSESQIMGINMLAYLDPENPLSGTEAKTFKKHGIYLSKKITDDGRLPTALHLLNAHLGGLAIDSNLFPGTLKKMDNILNQLKQK